MRRSRAAVAVALFTVLALLPLATAPVLARDHHKTERERVLAYWTRDRIEHARPRDFARTPTGALEAVKAPGAARGKPGGGGGTGGAIVTGASWIKGGAILARSGKVVFTMDGIDYVCSAAVVNDSRSTHSLILTAGHCAYDEVNEAFATNWTFIPQFDTAPTYTCEQSAFGCWVATGLVVHSGYATAGGFNEQATVHDFAIAIVAGGGKTPGANLQLDATVGGGFALQTSGVASGARLYAFGYPAAGRYKGKDLTYCAGNIFTDQYNDDQTWGMACNMTGGSSGGPWLAGFNETTGSGVLSSLNSYGYTGLANMYGPRFDSDTAAVLSAAQTRTSNHIVP